MERTFGRRDIGKSVSSLARSICDSINQEVPHIGASMVTRRDVIEAGVVIVAPAFADTVMGNPILKNLLPGNAEPVRDNEYTLQSFDMLDYLLTDRPGIGLTGTHRLSQTIQPETRSVYSVKFGDKRSFEEHEWDEENIYLVHDNSDPNAPYNFTRGIWMKRHMTLGESFRVSADKNMLERFGPKCKAKSREPYGYTMKLESYYPTYDTEGSLGILSDVIKLVYTPDGDQKEEFFYNKEIGWFQWNLREKDGDLLHSAIFSNFDKKKPVQPNAGLVCIWPAEEERINK